MELTIKKPAVIEPSQIPRTNRTSRRPVKLVQAACKERATAHMRIFKLEEQKIQIDNIECELTVPHPFCDRKPLKTKILWKFENQIAKVKNCSQPKDGYNYGLQVNTEEDRSNQLYLIRGDWT